MNNSITTPFSFSLHSQVAIVTGGTAGIGKACALTLAAHGATVIIFGTNAQRGQEAENTIKEHSGNPQVRFMTVDVADTAAATSAIDTVLKEHGKCDILVNNAGITRDGLLMKMSEADWDDVMNINAKSCFNCCKAVIRAMLKARKGRIINMSSVVGITGNAGQINYAASKAAVIGFTKSLAQEVASRGILVNCIAPGFIQTSMTDALNDLQKQEILAKIPLGRWGHPQEIANIVLFLASELATYMTGQVISTDGGMAM